MNLLEKISYLGVVVAALLAPLAPAVAPYVMSVGAAGLAIVRLGVHYTGRNVRMRRLYRMRCLAALLYVVAAFCMFRLGLPWPLPLLVGAVLDLYAVIVAAREQREGENF